jgi:hypothetical protein
MEAIAGVLFGAIGTFLAVITYVRALRKEWQQKYDRELERKAESEVKKFAAEREFAHLKRNHENLQQTLKVITEQIDEQERNLIEMKVSFTGMYHQIQHIAARLDGATGGYAPFQQNRDLDRKD